MFTAFLTPQKVLLLARHTPISSSGEQNEIIPIGSSWLLVEAIDLSYE